MRVTAGIEAFTDDLHAWERDIHAHRGRASGAFLTVGIVAGRFQDRPGCYLRGGHGAGSKRSCVGHNPRYDFNDGATVYGAGNQATPMEQQPSVGSPSVGS